MTQSVEVDRRDQPATWDDYHRRMSGIAAEMIGAAGYLTEHPDYANDERVAATFRDYAERFARVLPPGESR